MNSNSFMKNAIACICRVGVDYLLIPLALELTEIEYELKFGEKYKEVE